MSEKSPREYDYGAKKEEATRLELQALAMEPLIRQELQVLNLQKGMKILDAGCGTGAISRMIAEEVGPGTVYGVDMDTLFLEEAVKTANQKGISNIQFQEGNICNLDFKDGFFDATYCRLVLMHVNDPIETVQELGRVTKSNGIVGISDIDDGTFVTYPDIPHFHHLFRQFGKNAKSKGMDRYIGRQLYFILNKAGLKDITITPIPMIGSQEAPLMLQLATTNIFELFQHNFDEMLTKGLITQQDIETAIQDREVFINHPGAFFIITSFFATGRVSK